MDCQIFFNVRFRIKITYCTKMIRLYHFCTENSNKDIDSYEKNKKQIQ